MHIFNKILITRFYLFATIIPLPLFPQSDFKERLKSQIEIPFSKNKTAINKKAKSVLDSVVAFLKRDTSLIVKVSSGDISENEKYNQMIWDRVNNVINYMISQGANANRLVFSYAQMGEYGIIFLTLGEELDLPCGNEPPHPNLRKRDNKSESSFLTPTEKA